MTNNVFKVLGSDVDYDKFKYLFIFMSGMFLSHIFSMFLANFSNNYKNVNDEKYTIDDAISNSFMFFIIMTLIYFVTNGDGIFIGVIPQYMFWMLIAIFFSTFALVHKLVKYKGFMFINPNLNIFSIVFVSFLGVTLLNHFFKNGFSYKLIFIPMILGLYYLSGKILNKNISTWFIALMPIFLVDFKQFDMISQLIFSVFTSYVLYSGYITRYELYETNKN